MARASCQHHLIERQCITHRTRSHHSKQLFIHETLSFVSKKVVPKSDESGSKNYEVSWIFETASCSLIRRPCRRTINDQAHREKAQNNSGINAAVFLILKRRNLFVSGEVLLFWVHFVQAVS